MSGPSRALDAALAEHLFGWHFSGNRRGNWWLHRDRPRRPGDSPLGPVIGHERRRGLWASYNFPWWSSTYEGMEQVLNALTTRGLAIDLKFQQATGEWFVFFGHSRNQSGDSESLPRAVAIAALAYLESEASS